MTFNGIISEETEISDNYDKIKNINNAHDTAFIQTAFIIY